jgi:ubiquinone/menaquinone biosynthesis C-methylase UbiE
MTGYERHVLPRLVDLAMRMPAARAERVTLVPAARGRVLEVGIGSGLNLPFYGPGVTAVAGLDPSRALLRLAARRAGRAPCPVVLVAAPAEAIPFRDSCFDTLVLTWTLCSVPDPGRALGEMRRVLRPAGTLLFVEHGQAPDARVRRWQDRITPCWSRVAGGCHLNRPIDALIGSAGFELAELERRYRRGPRVMTYFYRGVARPAAAGRPPGPRRSAPVPG